MTLSSSFTLNTGAQLASVGLGCWMGVPAGKGTAANAETLTMVKNALEAGYTHFDTAAGYGNEEAVGQALRDSGKPRSSFFVTTKVINHVDLEREFDKSLERLGIEYIDLYLMHWPLHMDFATGKMNGPGESPTFSETWARMEKLLETRAGKVKQIGVSNFSVKNLEILLKSAKVVPAVNQVEAHPYCPQDPLREYCAEKGIHLTAYCPVGQYNSPILEEPLVKDLAAKYGKAPGTILLSWGVQRGFSVVPKSSNPGRLSANLDLVPLSAQDLASISALHTQPGKHQSLCDYGPGLAVPGKVWGWRVKEDLGWEYDVPSKGENNASFRL
ncbi:aldo/keto reductase [Rhodotorula diobovata]|uniref:Aldo/keto reductase n=1 Tax=Rhodotorula diobovata TaxID=5288 RepID=A0A5C5FXC0_9BASI|nr:aldo/keto reductase [Rhodotorula diobovata]